MKRWNVLRGVKFGFFAVLIGLFAALCAPSAHAADSGGSAASPTPPNVTVTSCMGRTDVAALDEYCGALPDAADRHRPAPRLEHLLPNDLVKRLKKSGSLGQLLLALPTAAPRGMLGSPSRAPSRARGLDAEDLLRTGRLGTRKKPATSALSAASQVVTDGAMNASFGSVLLLSTFGLAGTAWVRFRRRRGF
jgi:hypothetical protein